MNNEQAWAAPVSDGNIAIFVRQYLKQVVTIQNELLCRLLDDRYEPPSDLADVLEDAADTFMDLSAMIRQRHLRCSEPNLGVD